MAAMSKDDYTLGFHDEDDAAGLNEQGKRKKKLLALCLARLNEAESARAEYDADALLNIMFCAGRQYVGVTDSLGRFIIEEPVSDRVRAIVNFLRPLINKRVSRFIRNMPELARAADDAGDPEDEVLARGDDMYIKQWMRQQKIRQKYSELMGWAVKCGYGVAKNFWNPDIGPRTMEPKFGRDGELELESKCEDCGGSGFDEKATDESMLMGSGPVPCEACGGIGGTPVMLPVPEGDTHLKVVSFFDFFPDPTCRAISGDEADADYVIEREWLTPQQFFDMFPALKGKVGRSDERQTYSSGYALAVLMSPSAASFVSNAQARGRIEVFTLYARPNRKQPFGRVHRFTRNLYIEGFDFPDYQVPGCWHPFTLFYDFKIDGTVFPAAVVTDVRGIQQLFNKLWSLLIEAGELAVQPPMLQDVNSVQAGPPYPRPGAPYLYNAATPGGKPEFLEVPGVPTNVLQLLEMLRNLAREACLVGEDTPEGRSSGRILELMNEINDQSNVVQNEQHEAALRECAELALSLVKKNITNDRRVSVIGRAGEATVAVLKPFVDPTQQVNVITVRGRLLPDSPIARYEVMAQIAQFIVNPDTGQPDYPLILRLLDVGSDYIDRNRKQREAAVVENQWMREHQQPHAVSQEDNHQAHIFAHLDEAWMLPAGDPLRVAAFEPHLAQHRAYYMMAQQGAIAANQQQITSGQEPTGMTVPGQESMAGDPSLPQVQMAAQGMAQQGMTRAAAGPSSQRGQSMMEQGAPSM